MDAEVLTAVWIILCGPVAGSFVTALADRHCAGQDWVRERSHCAACSARLAPSDLIPILSYLRLRGRCRVCASPIPVHLLLGEVAGLAAASIVVVLASDPVERGLGAVYLLLLIGLFQSDRLCFRLPDALTFPLAGVGILLGTAERGLAVTLVAAVVGAAALWLIGWAYERARGRPGMGFGDVKMMLGLSAAVGLLALPWVTLIAAATALGRAALAGADPAERIPFGCYLAVAGAGVWIAILILSL